MKRLGLTRARLLQRLIWPEDRPHVVLARSHQVQGWPVRGEFYDLITPRIGDLHPIWRLVRSPGGSTSNITRVYGHLERAVRCIGRSNRMRRPCNWWGAFERTAQLNKLIEQTERLMDRVN